MDMKRLKGTAIVDMERGEKVGTVDDLVVDGSQRSIIALLVSGGGILHRARRYLPYTRISSVGDDAVMIQSDRVISETHGGDKPGYHSIGSIGNLRVVTDTGTFVGKVATAHFDPPTGSVTEVEVGSGGLGGLFSSSTRIGTESIISIGEDVVIVPASVVEGAG